MRTASLALGTATDLFDARRPAGPSRLEKLRKTAGRYALSAAGPVAMSGAHFLGAVLVLHTLSPVHFGFFSFAMTVVPFCVSAAAALIGAPTTIGIRKRGHVDAAELATFQKANLVLAVFAFAVVAVSMLMSGLRPTASLVFGLYGAAMSLRWLGRVYAYATEAPARPALSDALYGALLVAGLGALYLLDRMTMTYIAVVLFAAAAASLAAFDRAYLIRQFLPSREGRLADYAPVWRDLTRWSLLGVAATELAFNAHAYFVTFFSGPGSFAVLALGQPADATGRGGARGAAGHGAPHHGAGHRRRAIWGGLSAPLRNFEPRRPQCCRPRP